MNFFLRLNPPRASFLQDMSPAEAQLMKEHGEYWREWQAKGHVVVFGVVADPGGAFGLGIVDFENPTDARAFADADPTILANVGFSIDIFPMPFGAVTRGA